MTRPNKLRALLMSNGPLVAPGAFDGLSARLVEMAGFQAVYASGGAIARAAAMPDLGLLSLNEVVDSVGKMVDAVDIPVIADADTGFGGSPNIERTTRLFERAGVAGFHIEDQQFPKRCGHLDDKCLISPTEMCRKIRIVRHTLGDPDFLVIARTDAIAVEGFDAALNRANMYAEAGADMVFVEAPETVAQIEAIAHAIPGPKLINMFSGGKTPVVGLERLGVLGYALVIIPSDLQRAAIRAMQRTLAAIGQAGDSAPCARDLATFAEREAIVDTARFLALDRL
ncbi:MAG: isocitrate lyase [Rhodospirillales bacterium]|nr:isocitrate lyase [Rhodospirillales bacterium]